MVLAFSLIGTCANIQTLHQRVQWNAQLVSIVILLHEADFDRGHGNLRRRGCCTVTTTDPRTIVKMAWNLFTMF